MRCFGQSQTALSFKLCLPPKQLPERWLQAPRKAQRAAKVARRKRQLYSSCHPNSCPDERGMHVCIPSEVVLHDTSNFRRAQLLSCTAVVIALLVPPDASAEGLIPIDLFQSWLTEIEVLGPWGPVIFVLSVAAGEMVPLLPTQPLAIAGGLLFGAVRGALFVLIGTTLAAVAAFSFTKGVGRQLAARILRSELGEDPTAGASSPSDILSRFKGLQEAVEQGNAWQQFTAIVFLRLTPVIPFSASNYLLGLTPVQLTPFAVGTFSGMAAWCSVYATLGGAGRSLLKSGTSLDALLSDLLSQAEIYAEEAGVALGLLAATAGCIWWLRRQPEGSP